MKKRLAMISSSNINLLLLISFIFLTQIESQVTIAKNTQVTPRCGSQLISIEINFDPTQLPGGKFYDWIVVGVSGRPECRLRGNGETKYIVEIAVFNDPCLTQIPAQNVFQNRVRIGKNPVVILEGDQSITVKCVYGLPTVETLAMPVINPNFNIDNLAHAGLSETSLTSAQTNSFSSDNDPNSNSNFNFNQNQNLNNKNQFFISQTQAPEQPQGEANIIPNGMSSTDEEVNNQPSTSSFSGFGGGGNEGGSIQQPQTQFTANPIRPQIPIRLGNEDLQLHTALPPDSFVPRQQNNFENGDFNVNATASKRRSSFSIVFLLAIIFAIILILLCLVCLFFFLRKRREERNRRLLIDGVSSADESKRTESQTRWTDASTDGYASPGTGEARPGRSATSMFDKRTARVAESREVPIPVISVRKNRSDSAAHYSKAGNNRHNSTSSTKERKKSPAPSAPVIKHLPPLKSNLEEFVSKTYAMGEYNDLASPAYAYTSEVYDEREVDIGFGTNKSQKIKRRPRAEIQDESAVSSYRSITEIVHAAETTNLTPSTIAMSSNENKSSDENNEMEQVLIDCVSTIRGFGYRKLTEQEMGRWKNLIQRDKYLRNLLISSKSVAEIEDIFEGDDYKNMFSSTKWHEIAQCVHRALTSSLDRTNSQSQLQLFVGNVHSDW
ncbi:unnamed protein product [Caenorhabditis angaria]|uniref:ZP domain-containing protein n=1 Tax=Caenorhabditis angaria TaxID=860376 RepID=A0A9P1NB36_9PELO|nr:unnamed protein product [Caenorhabditis angaria]